MRLVNINAARRYYIEGYCDGKRVAGAYYSAKEIESAFPKEKKQKVPSGDRITRNIIIVQLRDYGFTYTAIGELFGISRQRAEQIAKDWWQYAHLRLDKGWRWK